MCAPKFFALLRSSLSVVRSSLRFRSSLHTLISRRTRAPAPSFG